MENTRDITTFEQLEEAAAAVLAFANTAAAEHAYVLALHGDLGAGKTTFTQTLAKQLGITETVTSPTFVIMKHYEVEDNEAVSDLVHIDAYRIEDLDEMRVLGFDEILKTKNTIVCIEWAEKIRDLLPLHTKHLHFLLAGEKRELTIEQHES